MASESTFVFFIKIDSCEIPGCICSKMPHTVEFDTQDDVIPTEDIVEDEMECEPSHVLYCESSGSERYPTFTVHLVMEYKLVGKRIFETEGEARRCMDTLSYILDMETQEALEVFQAYCP